MAVDGQPPGGTSNWTKRFRIKAYKNAFVIEVNLSHYQDPLGDSYNLNQEPNKEGIEFMVNQGGPVLIIFRDRLDMIELVHSSHLATSDLREHLGGLECSLQVHAILGILPIKGRRFLLVVPGQELVASLPPDCSPLGVWRTDGESTPIAGCSRGPETIDSVYDRCLIYPRNRNVFVVTNVIALPFHVPTDMFLSSKLSKTVTVPSAGSDSGAGSGGPVNAANSTEMDVTIEDVLGSSIANLVVEVERMLSKGIHFFSFDLDLTRSLQDQYEIFLRDGVLAVPQKVPCWSPSEKLIRMKKPVEASSSSCDSRRSSHDDHVVEDGTLKSSDDHNDGVLVFKGPTLMDYAEPCFVWNTSLCSAFEQNSIDKQWVCPLIQGSVSATKINTGEYFLSMLLITRRSSFRGGTRYFARGLDELGYTANFCEAEMLCSVYRGVYGTSAGAPGGLQAKSGSTTRRVKLNLCGGPSGNTSSSNQSPVSNGNSGVPYFPSSSLIQNKRWGGWWSFRQIRGSAPCFWDQLGFSLNPQPRINGTYEQNLRVFALHQKQIEEKYGRIHYIDLLSPSKVGEAKVSQFVKELIEMELLAAPKSETIASQEGYDLIGHGEGIPLPTSRKANAQTAMMRPVPPNMTYTDWDFHKSVQLLGFEDALKQFGSREDILEYLAQMGYFHTQGPRLQKGIFRTNCLDCLDRTTVIQWYLCERSFLAYLVECQLFKLIELQGVKYSQEAYMWLLKKSRQAGANAANTQSGDRRYTIGGSTDMFESTNDGDVFTQQFRRDCEPIMYQLPQNSKRPFHYPYRKWCPEEPLAPQPAFSTTSVLPYFSFAPSMSGEDGIVNSGYVEARIYFVGGWTNDRLLTIFFKCPLKYLNDKSVTARLCLQLSSTVECSQTLYSEEEASEREIERRRRIVTSKLFAKVWWMGENPNLQAVASGKDLPAIVPMMLPIEDADSSPGGGVGSGSGDYSMTTHVVKDGVSSMWADAGDLISVAYTGTASVLTPLLKSGRATILTNLTHLKRSVGRLYKHTFEDKAKQEAIDALVGAVCVPVPVVTNTKPYSSCPASAHSSMESLAPLDHKCCSIWVGTWNTGGGNSLTKENLSDWFVKGLEEKVEMFLVAFQEIVELASIGTVLNTRNRARENDAVAAVFRVKGIAHHYRLASVKTLVGVTSIVMVRQDCYDELTDLDTYVIKMGIFGQVGNKGAVVTHFTFKQRTFSFCNVHFNPDKNSDRTQERLNQFEKLFNTPGNASIEVATSTPGGGTTSTSNALSIRDHDYWFLAGDFNCPAMASVTEIEKWLAERKFFEFFQRDQLSWLRNLPSATCMQDVSEATVSFWPTYKYKKGTSTYDRKRAPSWCDRVLFGGLRLNNGTGSVQTLRYDRIKSIVSSDHRPVYFLCSIYESGGKKEGPAGSSSEGEEFGGRGGRPVGEDPLL